MTVSTWLKASEARLGNRLEAELLAAFGLAQSRAWLYAHGDEEISPDRRRHLDSLAARRQAGEPVAYLLGSKEFYGREFRVSPAVLIPRPETELLVERALAAPLPARARILDLGTGSGCILLTLAAERPSWNCCGVELSEPALEIARANRRRLALERVELMAGDLYRPVAGRRFDLIVSNPPYVAAGDPHLGRGDVRFEPEAALSAGDDGLAVIHRIVKAAPEHLEPGGWLMIEHGYDQAGAVRQLLVERGLENVQSADDLAGIARVAVGQLPHAG